MSLDFKLIVKYLLMNNKFNFLENKTVEDLNLYINKNSLTYTTSHFKMSTPFYTSQLVDMFAYEVLTHGRLSRTFYKQLSLPQKLRLPASLIVYHFHSLIYSERFFIFTHEHSKSSLSLKGRNSSRFYSITEFFSAANWLEREVAELHGLDFSGKRDIRNLLLPYGDLTAPFKKSFPTVGLRELYFNNIKEVVIQCPVSVQA